MSAPDPGLQALLGTLAGLNPEHGKAILDYEKQRRRTEEAEVERLRREGRLRRRTDEAEVGGLRRGTQEAEQRAEEEREMRLAAEQQKREAQERQKDALMLCPEHPEDRLSSVDIDTTLTRFDEAEVQVVPCSPSSASPFDNTPSGPANLPT
jgi:hypothetical protein